MAELKRKTHLRIRISRNKKVIAERFLDVANQAELEIQIADLLRDYRLNNEGPPFYTFSIEVSELGDVRSLSSGN